MKRIALLTLAAILVYSCEIDIFPNTDGSDSDKDNTEQTPDNNEDNDTETPGNPDTPQPPVLPEVWNYSPVTTSMFGHAGLSYIWDESVIPEITISITKDEWNNLLAEYDKNMYNKTYFPCDITYKKGSDTHTLKGSGVRLRGNTSRRRPEAHKNDGKHVTNGADWQH